MIFGKGESTDFLEGFDRIMEDFMKSISTTHSTDLLPIGEINFLLKSKAAAETLRRNGYEVSVFFPFSLIEGVYRRFVKNASAGSCGRCMKIHMHIPSGKNIRLKEKSGLCMHVCLCESRFDWWKTKKDSLSLAWSRADRSLSCLTFRGWAATARATWELKDTRLSVISKSKGWSFSLVTQSRWTMTASTTSSSPAKTTSRWFWESITSTRRHTCFRSSTRMVRWSRNLLNRTFTLPSSRINWDCLRNSLDLISTSWNGNTSTEQNRRGVGWNLTSTMPLWMWFGRIKLYRVQQAWKIVDFDRFLEGNRLIFTEAEASKLYKSIWVSQSESRFSFFLNSCHPLPLTHSLQSSYRNEGIYELRVVMFPNHVPNLPVKSSCQSVKHT